MAFGATTVWEVQTGGDDTNNGGGFDPGNANMSNDLAAGSSSGNTATVDVSSLSYTFQSRDVGHWLFIKSGTNWIPGWYQISSVVAGHAILNATAGSAILWDSSSDANRYKASTATGAATIASPTGGTWSIDYSQGTAIAFTDIVIDGTTNTNCTSAAKPFGKNFVGNIISITSGTGFTVQRVQIVSTSSITATMDKSLGTLSSTGGTGSLGGPLATPGKAGGLKIATNWVFIKSGTYNLSNSTANTAGGPVSDTTGSANFYQPSLWWGYNSLRGDDGTKPSINANSTAASVSIFKATATTVQFRNLAVDGTGTAIRGFESTANYCSFVKCKASNCANSGFVTSNQTNVAILCQATGCSTSGNAFNGATGARFIDCEAWANSVSGFRNISGGACINCISSANTGSADGFVVDHSTTIVNCVSYGNAGAGFTITGNGPLTTVFQNCIAEGNTGAGWKTDGVSWGIVLIHCAAYNNSAAYTASQLTAFSLINFVTQSAGSYFTNAASGDFSLNSTSGRGALLRGTGFPGTYQRGLTVGYADIGAAQHQDAGGGGLALPVSGGILA